jgi:hypothetical protein
MALYAHQVDLIAPAIRGGRVLSLAYPDLLFEIGGMPSKSSPFAHKGRACADTRAVFERMGAVSFDYVDIYPDEDGRYVDLNLPLPADEACREYDLVINPGTLEHCMDFFQAFKNANSYVREGGGWIFHSLPCNGFVNHGFYQLSPTFFLDYYQENGWPVGVYEMSTDSKGAFKDHKKYLVRWEDPLARIEIEKTPVAMILNVVAQRPPGATLDRLATQSKYRRS